MDMYKKATVLTTSQPTQPPNGSTNPSIAPLITMIAVLAIILIFCFCGAPAVRNFCRRKVCVCCPQPEDEAARPDARRRSSRSRRTVEENELVAVTTVDSDKNGEVATPLSEEDPAHRQ